VCFRSSAGLIACKDVGLFEAFSCPWPPSPTFYNLLEIERGAFDAHPQCRDGFAEEAFTSALGGLAFTRILCDVGDQAGIEHARVIMGGINATVEVEIGASEVHTHLFGSLL
jgi:hypothetical protein